MTLNRWVSLRKMEWCHQVVVWWGGSRKNVLVSSLTINKYKYILKYFNNVSITNNKIYYSSNISHFPEEFQLHNYCRILPLDIYERSGTYYAPQHAFVDFDWRNGPWCFVLNPEKVAKIWVVNLYTSAVFCSGSIASGFVTAW